MIKKIIITLVGIATLTLTNGCSTAAKSKEIDASPKDIVKSTITPEGNESVPTEADALCKQIHKIKKFPGRDPSEAEDVYYAAVMAQGQKIMDCLVDEITNETPTDDPRSAPSWQNYKVGDTAVFLLARLSGSQEILKEMLPPSSREEWKTNGVYAYFNYVSTMEHRLELQSWWRTRLAKERRAN